MNQPAIDLTTAADVVKEIFDNDSSVKDEFSENLSAEILKFSETWAACYQRYSQLEPLSAKDEQAGYVVLFVLGIIDDLLISMKLFVAGKTIASGNIMRQAIEGVAVAILCSSKENISATKGKGKQKRTVHFNYWEKLKSGDQIASPHLSIQYLDRHRALFGVNEGAMALLKNSKTFYNKYSHPGKASIAIRMVLGQQGSTFIGGGYDKDKLPAYKAEITERTGLCGIIPNLIDGLISRIS